MKKQLTVLLLLISSLAFSQMKNYNTKIVTPTRSFNAAVFTPKGYDTTTVYDVLIFLHGYGERGTDVNLLYKTGVPYVLKAGKEVDFIVIAPQNEWGGYDGLFPAIVTEIERRYKVKSFSLCGLSAGGGNTWEAITQVSQTFSSKFRAVEALSPSSFNATNVAWLKNTTTKFLSRAGNQGEELTKWYMAVAQDAYNAINAVAPGRIKLVIKAGWGHSGSFITPYQDTAFWNFMKPTVTITPPVIVVPPVVTPPVVPPVTTGLSYAQMVKIADSIVNAKRTPVQHPNLIRNDSLVTLPANDMQNGYMSKELVNKLLSLELQVSLNKTAIEFLSHYVDINGIKQREQLDIIIAALEALKNLK